MVVLEEIRAPLFVPASRPERFGKAAESGADAVILDLEDAVAPDHKDSAREALRTGIGSVPVLVRINALGTPWHQRDVEAVSSLPLAGFILPKAEDAASVAIVANAVGLPMIALVESARGLANARSLAAVDGVHRLAFGSIDFCADLGMEHLREVLLPARLELVLASRLAGKCGPIDGVTARIDDPALSGSDALHACSLGMTGKLCIHPRQVDAVKRAFRPSIDDVVWARRVLASGDGANSVDGAMVDEPVRIRARSILAKALAERG